MIKLINEEGTIRLVEEGKSYRLEPGERVMRGGVPGLSELDKIAQENRIPVGDMIAKLFDTVGFKDYWNEKHGGECAPCKQRQATLNYIKFRGPKWLSEWVKEDEK